MSHHLLCCEPPPLPVRHARVDVERAAVSGSVFLNEPSPQPTGRPLQAATLCVHDQWSLRCAIGPRERISQWNPHGLWLSHIDVAGACSLQESPTVDDSYVVHKYEYGVLLQVVRLPRPASTVRLSESSNLYQWKFYFSAYVYYMSVKIYGILDYGVPVY